MSHQLHFADAASLQDLNTYIRRARRIQELGVRLQAIGSVVAAWVPVMTPHSLTSQLPPVLGLRTMALSQPSDVDVTVELGAISERVARLNPASMDLPIPPTTINAPWAAVTPPRSGWDLVGHVPDALIKEAADAGIAEIAAAVPHSAGAHVVEQVRERVWGRYLDLSDVSEQLQQLGVPAGTGFGAVSLGFLSSAETATTQIHRCGRWVRLSCAGGFIVSRIP